MIHFDSIKVPVKLYGAIEDRNVHFRLLHRDDLEPVHQVLINPETDEVVPHESTGRAFITESGERVLLNPSELEALEPEPSRDIEILGFIPLQGSIIAGTTALITWGRMKTTRNSSRWPMRWRRCRWKVWRAG